MKEIIREQRSKILVTAPFLILFILGLNRIIYYNKLLGSCNIVNKWIAFTAITGGLVIGLIYAIVMNIRIYKTMETAEEE